MPGASCGRERPARACGMSKEPSALRPGLGHGRAGGPLALNNESQGKRDRDVRRPTDLGLGAPRSATGRRRTPRTEPEPAQVEGREDRESSGSAAACGLAPFESRSGISVPLAVRHCRQLLGRRAVVCGGKPRLALGTAKSRRAKAQGLGVRRQCPAVVSSGSHSVSLRTPRRARDGIPGATSGARHNGLQLLAATTQRAREPHRGAGFGRTIALASLLRSRFLPPLPLRVRRLCTKCGRCSSGNAWPRVERSCAAGTKIGAKGFLLSSQLEVRAVNRG
jgi:hypothetical protein